MKRSLLLVVLILLVGSTMLLAQVNEDDVLIVPKTSVAPFIDGELDTAVWHYVGETLAIVMDSGDAEEPYDWFDLFGSFRMMFDDEFLYLWLEVQDDIINLGTNHEYDGVELYFDANYSQTEGAFDGEDDLQLRFNVGEETTDLIDVGYGAGTNWGFIKDGIDFVILDNGVDGWQLEAAIPLFDLQLEPDLEFGFDLQINDADESTRENMYRWWANDNMEWRDASLFGTTKLVSSRVINDQWLEVPKGSAPTIDGAMAAGEWADAVCISGNRLDSGQNLFDHVEGWWDVRNWGYLKWDDTNLYYYLKVWDDYYDYAEDEASNWEFDSVELFFDGNNSDTNPYDGEDDIQIRFNLGQEGTESIDAGYGTGTSWNWFKDDVQYVVIETETGWDVEAAIPLADMQLVPGVDIGFEWQLNDCDDPDLTPNRTVYRWWAPGEPTWSDASLFGTIMLVEGTSAVDESPVAVRSYELQQNYPNPFNPTTSIAYSVAKTDRVQLQVYDMLGKEIATLVNEVKPAGQYTVNFDGSGLSSGVYFYTMSAGNEVFTNKMLLVK